MNTTLKKTISIIIILTIIPFALTGCTDIDGVENLAYVTAVGFDVSENNMITLTFQFAKLVSTGESGSSQPKSSELVTIDCASFDSGLAIVNSYISKKVSLSHCKIIVFSEAFAVNGISKEINTLTSNTEVRADCNVFISKSLAKDFLKHSVPTLTSLTPRYYEILLNSKEYTGFSDDIPLWKFYINIKSNTTEATAVLCGLNGSFTNSSDDSKNLMEKDVNYKAGETLLEGRTLSQNMGIAVFSGDKLVGELNAIECISYLMLTNLLETCNISVPDPFESNSTINVSLELKRGTKNRTVLVNNSPYIESEVYLNATITSTSSNSNYSKIEHINKVEEYVESYIEANLKEFLYKTSKKFKSDIIGFGENLVPNYLTTEEWEKVKWASLYKDSFFDVNVDVLIKSTSLFIRE